MKLSFLKFQAKFSEDSDPIHLQTLLSFLLHLPLANVSSHKLMMEHLIFRHSFYEITSKNLLILSLCLIFNLQRIETTNRTSFFHITLSLPDNHKLTTIKESNVNL